MVVPCSQRKKVIALLLQDDVYTSGMLHLKLTASLSVYLQVEAQQRSKNMSSFRQNVENSKTMAFSSSLRVPRDNKLDIVQVPLERMDGHKLTRRMKGRASDERAVQV